MKRKSSKKPASKAPVNAATKAPAPPSSTAFAAQLGIELTPPLPPAQVQRLRKALPGYTNVLDDAAELLDVDRGLLNLQSIAPKDLTEIKARQKYLAAREAVAEAVYEAAYYQRLQVDDRGIGLLLDLARRVHSRGEEDPDILIRWKSILDFVSTFRPGRKPTKAGPSGDGK